MVTGEIWFLLKSEVRRVAPATGIPSVSLAHWKLCCLDHEADCVEIHRTAFGRYRLDQCSQRGGEVFDVHVCQTRLHAFVLLEKIVRFIAFASAAAAELFRFVEQKKSVAGLSCQCNVETP